MKLLESSHFEALNSALSFDTGQCRIVGRIESYSCKMVGNDKRLFKQSLSSEPGTSPNDLQALSPPQSIGCSSGASPSKDYSRSSDDSSGHLCDTISRKTLFYLIGTLNASFLPDYDFSGAKSDEFSKEPSISVSTLSLRLLLYTIDSSRMWKDANTLEKMMEKRSEWEKQENRQSKVK